MERKGIVRRTAAVMGTGAAIILFIVWGWSGMGGKGSSPAPDTGTPPRTEATASATPVATPTATPSAEPTPEGSPATPSPAPTPSPSPEAALVPYNGPVEHIFFHPLIVYPELAFDGDRMEDGYDDWFVTVPEFKSILSDLYRNGYMLVDIRSLYEAAPSGSLKLSKLLLPKGKKPLVLSVDDLNYYAYMRENGNAARLVLDGEGKVAAYSVAPDGTERISREDEIVPILDAFVEEHPDFSFRGAKGVLALTGYEGILGYATHLTEFPSYEEEMEGALRVVKRLRETGWSFASHGWGHPNAEQVDLARMEKDTARWKREVEPITGPTPVFIYPYGARLKHSDPKFRVLTEAGFTLFCGVGPNPYLSSDGRVIEMDRRHVDGIALRTQSQRLKPLFDAQKAFDKRRPQR